MMKAQPLDLYDEWFEQEEQCSFYAIFICVELKARNRYRVGSDVSRNKVLNQQVTIADQPRLGTGNIQFRRALGINTRTEGFDQTILCPSLWFLLFSSVFTLFRSCLPIFIQQLHSYSHCPEKRKTQAPSFHMSDTSPGTKNDIGQRAMSMNISMHD